MPPLTGWRLTVVVNAVLVFAQVSFGGYHVYGKYALDQGVNPIIFSFYREIMAGPLLVVIAAFAERVLPDFRKDWWRFIILGTLGVYGNQLLFVLGLWYTSATQAAIMQPCIPVFTTIITLSLRMEQFSFLKVLGILASATGAVVMVGFDDFSLKSDKFLGTLCLVGNTLCVSIYYVYCKKVMFKKYPPITITAFSYMVGAVEMGLTSLIFVFQHKTNLYHLTTSSYGPLAYSIVFATVLAYMSMTWANSKASTSLVAAYNSLQPLTAALLSFFFLKEVLVWREGEGALLILLGLGLVTFARSREVQEVKTPDGDANDNGTLGDGSGYQHVQGQGHAVVVAVSNEPSCNAADGYNEKTSLLKS